MAVITVVREVEKEQSQSRKQFSPLVSFDSFSNEGRKKR
jgi:hypothetical protein